MDEFRQEICLIQYVIWCNYKGYELNYTIPYLDTDILIYLYIIEAI